MVISSALAPVIAPMEMCGTPLGSGDASGEGLATGTGEEIAIGLGAGAGV